MHINILLFLFTKSINTCTIYQRQYDNITNYKTINKRLFFRNYWLTNYYNISHQSPEQFQNSNQMQK